MLLIKTHMDFIELSYRSTVYNQIKTLLVNFSTIGLNQKRGIYIHGVSGVGKTRFIMNILRSMNYDVIVYGADTIRNVTLIESFSNMHISKNSIVGMFNKKIQPMIIVIDDIDSMLSGDRGAIATLTKLVRPKKTKKQKTEAYNATPIICIGTNISDKTIRELCTSCYVFELVSPTPIQIKELIQHVFEKATPFEIDKIYTFTHVDISKIFGLFDLYGTNLEGLMLYIKQEYYQKIVNCDSKTKTRHLLHSPIDISQHSSFLGETERVLINKLWHENVVDLFNNNVTQYIQPYTQILSNICYADYIDRITFQKQIWQLNEMSSLIKTCKNSRIVHTLIPNEDKSYIDIRFTKILTKYSTEYNNFLFIRHICQTLNIDKKDIVGYITTLIHLSEEEQLKRLENYDIEKTELIRLIRYINKYRQPSKYDISNISDEYVEIDNVIPNLISAKDDSVEI